MFARLMRSVLVLPGTVIGIVPAVVLWATSGTAAARRWIGFADPAFWVGVLFGLGGLALAAWTVRLFVRVGQGTPAPWDPPEKLVLRGPYRHVRNPMISAVFMMLAAEAILADSWPLAVWLAVFYLVNAWYIPRVEERGLEARFGDAYRHYMAHVPRWFPTPMAYLPEDEPTHMDREQT